MSLEKRATKQLKSFNKVIIWGVKSKRINTFYYIYKGFYDNLKFLGIKVIWLDNRIDNNKYINPGDLVIVANVEASKLVWKRGVYYCLHNIDSDNIKEIDKNKFINLQVYTDACTDHAEKVDSLRYYDAKNKILYQPWGTPIPPSRFYQPSYPGWSKLVFWVGSIWNNERNQGNKVEIQAFVESLKQHNLLFLNPKKVPDWLGIILARNSRISPAIGGRWQVEVNYLPCRFFKNISYGQLGITNIPKLGKVFRQEVVYSPDINKLTAISLNIPKKKYLDLVHRQQKAILKYTYVNNLYYIGKYIKEK